MKIKAPFVVMRSEMVRNSLAVFGHSSMRGGWDYALQQTVGLRRPNRAGVVGADTAALLLRCAGVIARYIERAAQ